MEKQNVAARLSAVLRIPVEKEHDETLRWCLNIEEMEKLEMLSKCLKNIRKKARQSLQDQRELFESGPIRKRAIQKSPFHSSQRNILMPVGSQIQNTLAELPSHEELIVSIKPKKITSLIELCLLSYV